MHFFAKVFIWWQKSALPMHTTGQKCQKKKFFEHALTYDQWRNILTFFTHWMEKLQGTYSGFLARLNPSHSWCYFPWYYIVVNYLYLPFHFMCPLPLGVSWDDFQSKLIALESLSQDLLLGKTKFRWKGNVLYYLI